MELLIDVHAHLDHAEFNNDLGKVVERAKNNGISIIICNGLNINSNRKVLELSKKYDIIEAALGFYPIDAQKLSHGQVDSEIRFIEKNKNKIKAIGEVGLDYYWEKDKKNREKQKAIFQKLIELSEKTNKPLIIHSRKAEMDCVDMIKSSNVKKSIFHCFGGSSDLVKEICDNNYYFSIPTNIAKSKQIKKIVKNVPLSQLFTETDSPYLGPFSGKRNEPANITETIKVIAKIKGMDEKEVVNNIYMNYQRVF